MITIDCQTVSILCCVVPIVECVSWLMALGQVRILAIFTDGSELCDCVSESGGMLDVSE